MVDAVCERRHYAHVCGLPAGHGAEHVCAAVSCGSFGWHDPEWRNVGTDCMGCVAPTAKILCDFCEQHELLQRTTRQWAEGETIALDLKLDPQIFFESLKSYRRPKPDEGEE
jgi:hypothetical protein